MLATTKTVTITLANLHHKQHTLTLPNHVVRYYWDMLSKVRSYLIMTGLLTTVTALLAFCSLLSFAGQAFDSGNICELMADLRLPIGYGLLFCAVAALI
jgi:hypothetical protein